MSSCNARLTFGCMVPPLLDIQADRLSAVLVTSYRLHLSRLQEDVVHEDLTVRENLAYSAWLRSARHVPHKSKHDVVDDIIDVLALNHIQHSVVGSAERRGIR